MFIGRFLDNEAHTQLIKKLCMESNDLSYELILKKSWCVITEAYEYDLYDYLIELTQEKNKNIDQIYDQIYDKISNQLYKILETISKEDQICLDMKPSNFVINIDNKETVDVKIIDIISGTDGCNYSTYEMLSQSTMNSYTHEQTQEFSLTYSFVFLANFLLYNKPCINLLYEKKITEVMNKSTFLSFLNDYKQRNRQSVFIMVHYFFKLHLWENPIKSEFFERIEDFFIFRYKEDRLNEDRSNAVLNPDFVIFYEARGNKTFINVIQKFISSRVDRSTQVKNFLLFS